MDVEFCVVFIYLRFWCVFRFFSIRVVWCFWFFWRKRRKRGLRIFRSVFVRIKWKGWVLGFFWVFRIFWTVRLYE